MCELEADDRVINETLTKSLALVCILYALLVADTGETKRLDNDADALVVEVGLNVGVQSQCMSHMQFVHRGLVPSRP
jgi:hypothetical protein